MTAATTNTLLILQLSSHIHTYIPSDHFTIQNSYSGTLAQFCMKGGYAHFIPPISKHLGTGMFIEKRKESLNIYVVKNYDKFVPIEYGSRNVQGCRALWKLKIDLL